MSDMKQFKKQSKKLKQEIKATKAHLEKLKKELETLRQNQQHQVIDEEMDHLLEQPSLFKRLASLLSSRPR